MSLNFWAQGVSDVLAGGAGWVGAGLLGSVLAWLFFKHIPDRDRQLEAKDKLNAETMTQKDQRHELYLEKQFERVDKVLAEQRTDFKSALAEVLAHCARESKVRQDAFERETLITTRAREKEVTEITAAIVDLRRTLEEVREYYLQQKKEAKHDHGHP